LGSVVGVGGGRVVRFKWAERYDRRDFYIAALSQPYTAPYHYSLSTRPNY
jgi:hypothetical protein